MFEKAVALGSKRYETGGYLPLHEAAIDRILERTVRAKVRERFGGRLKAMVSGGAPLNYEVALFFKALGLPILQGYGQTETSPVVSVNPPRRSRLDTVGPPLRGVEVKIAEDGEILVRGELVMKGYWNDPEATAQVLKDGWLHTGDIGEIDGEGYLRITDRKKDIIVNSGGDNLAPQRVEGILLLEPDIAQAVVYGDRKPHLVALIVPSRELLREAAKEARSQPSDPALASHPLVERRIREAVARSNKQLAAIERIRRHRVLTEPFSVENGLMTPTMKPRRTLIYRSYAEELEGLYAR
jgi:long-chain acyl-CoA synthetase